MADNPMLEIVDYDMVMALGRVFAARIQSINKHGELKTVTEREGLILCEEAGEVAAEILKMTKPGGTGSHRQAKGTPEATMFELAQVAQHAIAMMILLEQDIETEREADKHGND